MNDPIVGKEVDGYRIQEVLGRGGMGTVYKAEEVALSRPVALKRLNPELAGDESFLSRFRSEARAIARINSPYIVQVFTLSETEIGLLIVMEYVEGGTLKQRIDAGDTDWKESLPLIQQTLTALEHAHGAGVVHRDIKPQNILLSDIVLAHGIRVKMTDFGIAKVNTTGDPSRTVTQGVYGTLHYMSPEQVKGHGQVDRRSDIYSLGVTCYEMLAGRLPFDEDSTEYTIMRTIVEEDLPELGAFASDVPDKLRDIVMKAVAKDPEDRFQSAAEMQDALGELDASSEQGYSDQELVSIPADLYPLDEDLAPLDEASLLQSTPEKDLEVSSDEADETSTTPAGRNSSLMVWRIAGAGAILVVVLAGAWYFATRSTAPSAGSEPEAPVVAENDASQGTNTEGAAADEAPEDETTPKTEPPAEVSDERNVSGPRPEGGNASDPQSEESTGDQTTDEEATQQAAGTEAAGEEAPGAETEDPDTTDQQASQVSDTGESGGEDQRGLPPPIAALIDIDAPSVLTNRIDELVAEGQLIRGEGPEDFFTPNECYIFFVDPEANSVEAVLGPETDSTRVELRSGEKIEDWSSRYSNSFQIWTALTNR